MRWRERGLTILPEKERWPAFLAAGLGSGWLPRAPGTWGSLASLPPAWLLLQYAGLDGLLLGTLLLTLLGCGVCFLLLPGMAEQDPGWIVIDEWAGQWLGLALIVAAIGSSWPGWLAAFLSFRLLDILKPCPIPFFERWGPPWWSIMADDLVAGLLAGGSVAVIASLLPGLA